MKRRTFVEALPLCGLGLVLSPSLISAVPPKKTLAEGKRVLLKVVKNTPIELLKGRRLPFGWSAIGVAPGDSILFEPEEKLPNKNLLVRVSVAQEIWDNKRLHVRIPGNNFYLGAIDIRYSSILVPYEMEIAGEHINLINQYGLEMTLEAPSPLWIFDRRNSTTDNQAFLPHFVFAGDVKGTPDNFLNCFLSVNSVQAFGWREGTVLDGLWQIYSRKSDPKALRTINQHLELYFDNGQNLIFETSQSIPCDNRIDGIESTIPFATLARINANHPILNTVVEAWNNYTKSDGMVIDGKMISAEGCYTVAYPMAVIGKVWQRDDLKQKAIEQLKHRFVLVQDKQFYLRSTDGNLTYKNWARGAAWFLLGFARTMSELKDEIHDEEVFCKFREGIDLALSMRRKDGLWNCFMDDQNSLPDTSGSAGIAAAILTGVHDGFLPVSYRKQAENCWNTLQNYLTPDGFLRGAAQDNRGGTALQQSDYRVIAQMGMGLMAQLYATI